MHVSPKHGLNPSLTVCFFCGEDNGTIALFGHLPGDEEAPRRTVTDYKPCDTCKKWMEQGVIFISTKVEDTNKKNPYRTGGWVVLREEAVKRAVTTPELLEHILKHRVAFVPDDAWDKMGLPR